MRTFNRYRLLHILVIIYLVTAFSWWSILLYQKNEENYKLQKSLATYDQTLDLEVIQEDYDKQRKMIFGEGLVLGLSILVGLILINRGFLSEIKLNKQLNDFLLSVTHELKTPIASLKLATQTLKRDGLPQDKQKDLVLTCIDECLRLEDQVNNILTAAQIEQAYTFNFEKCALSPLVLNRVHRYQKIYQNRNIVMIDNSHNPMISIDKEAIIKAIDNLLLNALKYSATDAPVTVELSQAEAEAGIAIKDVGVGIHLTEKKKIWDKFYRIGSEETREAQGTGLGLWIAKRIVAEHRGTITLRDNPPRGSIFKIHLPI